MRSFTAVCALSFAGSVCGRVLQAPTPTVTAKPSAANLAIKRQGPDAVSLAKVLLTAIPESLRQVAATNLPAVSSILWEEFLDDKKPWWFLELPPDIQSYLISQFGPPTAIPTPTVPVWSSAEPTGPSLSDTSAAQETSAAESSTEGMQSSLESTMATSVSAVSSSSGTTALETGTTTISGHSTAPASKSTSPPAPSADSNDNQSGLSRQQKIGVGVGVPLALLGLAALGLGCCFLRRRRHRSVNGSVPPSSPGFIPRFAFQEKSSENLEHRPLNRDSDWSGQDLIHSTWDDDAIEPTNAVPNTGSFDHTPVMAPALFHTHSSNRARGMRTSYTSLRSVPEVSESDEAESPVLPRMSPPQETAPRSTPNRYSPPRALIPPPMVAAPQIKRKPVPSSPNNTHSPAADLASQSLLRQTMPDAHGSSPPHFGNYTQVTAGAQSTQVSPLEEHSSNNPFSNNYSYVEDYGPEYNDGHIDIEDGLYGGHTSLSRYPEPKKSSKTEWPLRNTIGRGHRRNRSPMWDRVYQS